MALHGAELHVGDVDVLMSRADATRLLERHGRAPRAGSAHLKFRSDVFGRLVCGGYTVEVMGGFHVRDGADWLEVRPQSRIAFRVGGVELFAPSVEELIDMCRLFGRPKDAERGIILKELNDRSG
jgi:hypothetical protein